MPVYEYKCSDCGKVFDLDWKDVNSVPASQKCPDCSGDSPRKYSLFLFSFSPYLKELREGNMIDY